MTDDETITVCVTFAGSCPDDYQVFWRSVPIGRIMRSTGYPTRDAQWSWVISLPREGGDCGTGDDLDDCKRQAIAAWLRIRARVTTHNGAHRGGRALSAGRLSGAGYQPIRQGSDRMTLD